jgi:hypothetical protein
VLDGLKSADGRSADLCFAGVRMAEVEAYFHSVNAAMQTDLGL